MKILFVVLLLTNVIGPSYAQQLVEFKLFHKQADIEAYLKSLCKTADWEVDSIVLTP